MEFSFENIINTIGVTLVLLAFFLLVLEKLRPKDKIYLILNVVGASLSCYGSWLINAIPFVVLEGTWALVALVGLIRSFKGSNKIE